MSGLRDEVSVLPDPVMIKCNQDSLVKSIQFGFYFIIEIVFRSLFEIKSLWTSELECEFEKTIRCNEMRARAERELLGFNPEDFSLDIDISAIVLYLSFPHQGSFSGITSSQN